MVPPARLASGLDRLLTMAPACAASPRRIYASAPRLGRSNKPIFSCGLVVSPVDSDHQQGAQPQWPPDRSSHRQAFWR